MSDVASILGIKSSSATAEETLRLLTEGSPRAGKPKVVKHVGMARELFQLVGQDSIAATVQPSKVVPAFKSKRSTNTTKGKWVWTAFSNSGRR